MGTEAWTSKLLCEGRLRGLVYPLTPETGEEVLPSPPPHPSTCLTQQQQQQQQQQQLQQQLFL
jgi:hypothetical protein